MLFTMWSFVVLAHAMATHPAAFHCLKLKIDQKWYTAVASALITLLVSIANTAKSSITIYPGDQRSEEKQMLVKVTYFNYIIISSGLDEAKIKE